jgi:hypothetical protein
MTGMPAPAAIACWLGPFFREAPYSLECVRSTIRVEYWGDVHLPEKPYTDLFRKNPGGRIIV